MGRGANARTVMRPDYNQHAYSTSLYVEDGIGIGNFLITPGIRFDHYRADLLDLDKTYHRFSKALGLKYSFTDNLVGFANYTEIFKGPGFGELTLVAPGRYTGSLEPTRGHNKEIGFNYSQAGLLANQDNISITAKYFHTNYNNINQSVPNPNGSGSIYASLGAVKLAGVEAQLRYQIENFSTSISYARARSMKKADGLTAFPDTGDRYTFGAQYRLAQYDVELGWNTILVRGLDYLEMGRRGLELVHKETYAVSNAYVNWAPKQAKGLEFTFGVDNLFNRAYKDQSTQYYNAVDLDPGRNYKLSVSYKF